MNACGTASRRRRIPGAVLRRLGAACLCAWLCLAAGPARADVTPTAKDFVASGKNRAMIQIDRAPFADRLDVGFLIGTLAKKSETTLLPSQPRHLFQEIDPVPLDSQKVYTPWLNHFKQAVVFVIGRLDPKRLRIATWSVVLRDAGGREIKTFGGAGLPPEAFFWNARDREYRPVPVGRSYIPEITLVDEYGAKVSLPQKMFVLDQFLWEDPGRLIAGFTADSVFIRKRAQFSQAGALIIQELSNVLNQQDAAAADLFLSGLDDDLLAERGQAVKDYLSRENLRLKRIRVQHIRSTMDETVTVTAVK